MARDVDLSLIVAVYAALLSTLVAIAGGFWAVYTWRRDRRTYVEVETSLSLFPMNDADVVIIQARSRSQHRVRVVDVGFLKQNLRARQFGTVMINRPEAGKLPMEIDPNDAGFIAVRESSLANAIDFFRPLVAYVTLSTGEVFYSKPRTLRSGGPVPEAVQHLIDELEASVSARSGSKPELT